MSRFAQVVCRRSEEIRRNTRLVTELPSCERVRVVERDGKEFTGTVVERPALQVFEDARGREGINALLRIDDPSAPPWSAELWLSDIRTVESLGHANG